MTREARLLQRSLPLALALFAGSLAAGLLQLLMLPAPPRAAAPAPPRRDDGRLRERLTDLTREIAGLREDLAGLRWSQLDSRATVARDASAEPPELELPESRSSMASPVPRESRRSFGALDPGWKSRRAERGWLQGLRRADGQLIDPGLRESYLFLSYAAIIERHGLPDDILPVSSGILQWIYTSKANGDCVGHLSFVFYEGQVVQVL